jgi:lysophospholipase L1-like esterase
MPSWSRRRRAGAAVALAIAVSVLAPAAGLSRPNDVAAATGKSWRGSWAAAVTGAEPDPLGTSHRGFTNQTVRQIVRLSVGGSSVRIRLTNIHGEGPVTIGAATVARPDVTTPQLWDIDTATVRALRFNGRTSATMLRGQELLSDPVAYDAPDAEDLVVSLYFPTATGPTTWHATTRKSSYSGPGDLTASDGTGFTSGRTCCWFFLSGVDVLRRSTAGSVVVLGDSLGDATGSTLNADMRWPDLLAERMLERWDPTTVPGILNASLAGNRLNHDGTEPGAGGFPGFVQLGPNAGARLQEDAWSQLRVRTLIIQLGLSDLWMNGDSADAIITAILQIRAQARQRGLRVLVATLSPYEGYAVSPGASSGEWTPEKEGIRVEINERLRNSPKFDGVIDVDAVLRDPAAPSRLRPEFDSGDHMHPNDAGNQAIANAVRLRLLAP